MTKEQLESEVLNLRGAVNDALEKIGQVSAEKGRDNIRNEAEIERLMEENKRLTEKNKRLTEENESLMKATDTK